jgi:hypothetical protein
VGEQPQGENEQALRIDTYSLVPITSANCGWNAQIERPSVIPHLHFRAATAGRIASVAIHTLRDNGAAHRARRQAIEITPHESVRLTPKFSLLTPQHYWVDMRKLLFSLRC